MSGGRPRSLVAIALSAVFALALPVPGIDHAVRAQACAAEAEPNDALDAAHPLAAAGCATGTLIEDDLADLFLWTIDPAAAGEPWSVAFSSPLGPPAVLTMSALDPAVEAPTIVGSPVAQLRPPIGAPEPVRTDDLLLPPGRYLLAVSPAGPWTGATTKYRLDLEPGESLPPSADLEPNDDPPSGAQVTDAFESSGDAGGSVDHYAWRVTEGSGRGLWRLELQGPIGVGLAMAVTDADGALVADILPDPDGVARLPDLGLAAGTYDIRVTALTEPPAPYVLRAVLEEDATADPEPNDQPGDALPIAPDVLMTGRLARAGDRDAYRLEVDPALGSVLLDARLSMRSGPSRRLCLASLGRGDAAQLELACDDGDAHAALTGLLLVPGEYLLIVSGGPSPLDPYYLRVDPTVAPRDGFELEPNDTPVLATAMEADERLSGRLDNPDHVRVLVEEGPQLWDVEARGDDVRLLWERTDGAALGIGADPDGNGERSLLTDVYLIPGDHWFRLDGSGGYTFELTPLGPLPPDAEREPNGELSLANALPMDGSLSGRIATGTDADVFRFSLVAPEHVRIRLEPPAATELFMFPDGDLAALASTRVTPAPGEPLELDLVLPAGDHGVRVTGPAHRERYRLTLSREDPFAVAVDQEPNDQVALARPVPADLRIEGITRQGDPMDWYRLKALPAAGELTFAADGQIDSLVLHDGASEVPLTADDAGRTYRSPAYPAGALLALGVLAEGEYAIAIEPGTTGLVPGPERGEPLPVTMDLAAEALEVAAFATLGQRVEARLAIENSGGEPLQLSLDAATSHPAWQVTFEDHAVELPTDGRVEVPVAISVPAQAAPGAPVRITVRARDHERQATSHVELEATPDAPLVEPFRWWGLPDALLGGLDAAAVGLGAVPIVSVDPTAEATLHDGVVALGGGFDLATSLPLTLGVDLAGDDPVPVVGAILDLTAGPGPIAGTVRAFELLLSTDGVTYESALEGSLSGAHIEQAFVLPDPVEARFAQLRITSTHPGADDVRLGEWKVVAAPGWLPTTDALDILDPGLGGHIAWLDPQPGGLQMLDEMLTPAEAVPSLLGFDGQETGAISWVLGFQDGRAAQLTELQWVDHAGPDPGTRLGRLEVSASMEGPVGPWTPVGTWRLERDAAGIVSPYAFEAPIWARYLRLSGPVPDREVGVVELPQVIRALEHRPAADYRSVAGEWGYGTSDGPFEWQLPIEVAGTEPGSTEAQPGADASLLALEPGRTVAGRVARGLRTDTHAFSVPEGQQAARFVVAGRPTVGVALSLFDESGAQVPLAMAPGLEPGTVQHEAIVVPGASYQLLVEQPPFSVVVAYDTSGSVGHYVALMSAALRTYAAGILPGEEAVQLIDFEGPPMPDEFSDDPWLILNSLDAHAGSQTGSSNAEIGLIDALDLLAAREGARAILLMTDAETSSYHRNTELWRWLELIRPRIFAVHIMGMGTPVHDQRLMQGWAAVGAGHYDYARTAADIGEAFDRMSTWLRRPADYSLRLELSSEPPAPPEPGALRVVSDPDAVADPEAEGDARGTSRSQVAVELILDTSGSMLERMGRKRRIEVAKSVLGRLVSEQLDPGMPVALRVFRQERRSCESQLAVPLAPLEPAALAATIDGLTVDRTVRTPLAAAIEAVAGDLASATGPRIVVVVSDGEESCGGDPEAAVQGLVDQGFDVTVNVVGMGLDRKARRRIGRLAAIGGGTYHDARDADDLAAALRGALGAPYVVLDESGTEVGRSTIDGDAVSLPPGTYRIALVGAVESLDVVDIESGSQLTIVAPRSSPG